MRYYAIKRDGEVAAVCSELDFRRWQKKHSVIVVSDAKRVEAVQAGETFYRDTWMAAKSGGIDSVRAEVVEIPEDEYAALAERLKTGRGTGAEDVGQIPVEQQAKIDELGSRQRHE